MKFLLSILTVTVITSCGRPTPSQNQTTVIHDTIEVMNQIIDTIYIPAPEDKVNNPNLIMARLPDWFVQARLLDDLVLKNEYTFDNRMNPLYLEEDFNGDQSIDLAIPILHQTSGKTGFAVIHGTTHQVFILGAGVLIKDGLSDEMNSIDIWKINRLEVNEPGLDGNGNTNPNGPLKLSTPSIQIEKADVGGGQIYWNGQEYVYFHQTC